MLRGSAKFADKLLKNHGNLCIEFMRLNMNKTVGASFLLGFLIDSPKSIIDRWFREA